MSSKAPDSDNVCKDLESMLALAKEKIHSAKSSDEVEQLRVEFLGKKGKVSALLSILRDATPEDRKKIGATGNKVKINLETGISRKKLELEKDELNKKLENDELDSSLPGLTNAFGRPHPVRQIMREACQILERAGLKSVYGPEVEYEDYCFDRLNFKPGHAARDMQATFFVKNAQAESLVLRTHTSPVQVRVLLDLAKKEFPLPIRMFAPGRVYRVDDDATHSPMFHQIEGLVVDKTSGMGDLKAHLDYFFRQFFSQSTKVRFRPSYFPFTEPSAEVDISCVFCDGKGCRVCKSSGWLEVAGAGLVHPEVFKACGWDPEAVGGWAFGMGIERLAMLKLRVPDLRSFFENRLSFLRATSLGSPSR